MAGAVGMVLAAISERSAEAAHLLWEQGGRGFDPRRSDHDFHGAIVQMENTAFARRQRGFESHWLHHGGMAEMAYSGGLENRRRFTPPGGSNPPPSAMCCFTPSAS